MASWQDLFNQINNTQTFSPLGNNAVQFNSPINPLSSSFAQGNGGQSQQSPNSGGIGDTLATIDKNTWNDGMDFLDYALGKPIQSVATAVIDPALTLKNMITGDQSNNPNTWSDLASIWSAPGSTVARDRGDQLFGWDRTQHGNLANAFSPGNLLDIGTQVFGGGAEAKALGAVGDIAKGLMGANKAGSVYRQAAEDALATPSETALNDQPRQPWNQTIPQGAAMGADVGGMPSNLQDWSMPQASADKAALNANMPNIPDFLSQDLNLGQTTKLPSFPSDASIGKAAKEPWISDPMGQINQVSDFMAKNGIEQNPETLSNMFDWIGNSGAKMGDVSKQLDYLANMKKLDIPDILTNNPEEQWALGAKAGNTPASLLPNGKADMTDLSSMLDSLNNDLKPAEQANVLDTLGKGTGLRPEDLQNIAELNQFNPTKGAFDIPDFLHDPAATESTAHPNPTTELPNEMPSAEEVYQGLGNKFDSPLLQASKQLSEAQKPQWLQRIQDAMARWGIMGSGINTQFMKDSGASNVIKNSLAGANNDSEAVAKWAEGLAKGMTPSDMNDLKDALRSYENGAYNKGDSPIFDKLLDALHNGVEGTNTGLLAEQGSGVAAKDLRKNYFPLMMDMKNTPEDIKNLLAQEYGADGGMNLNRHVYDRSYALDRKFQTAQDAQDAGYAVHDPITAAALRLQKSAHDVNMANMYKQLEQEGMQKGYAGVKPVANGVKYNSKDGTTNALNGKYIHKDLAGTLTTMFDRTPWSHANIPVISPALQNWDKMTQFYRNATLYTPMVHLHNVFGNALMGAGISPADYLKAEQALKNAPDSLAVQMAKKTGALGEEFGQDTVTRLQKAMGNNPTGWAGLKDKAQSLQNTTLWNREKALRQAVFNKYFDQSLSQGLNTADAANVARDATLRHMVDYSSNNLSTFEKEVMSRIDPFYRWHKGNYALQASKILTDPNYMRRVAEANVATNDVNSEINGHGTRDNIGGFNGIQIPMDGQGNYMNYDPYLPFQETGKLLGQNPANTAFNRFNPFIREAMNQATNNQFYPAQSLTPTGKDYMTGTNYPIANPATSGGQQMIDRVGHALSHTILPEDQAIPSAVRAAYEGVHDTATGKFPSVPAVDQLIADLTGGFLQSTPTSQQKVNAQTAKEMKWLQQYKKMAQRGN